MSTSHGHEPALNLEADPSDTLQALLLDATQALHALLQGFRDVACPGCDPTGERAADAGVGLFERYDVDIMDSEMLLSLTADCREAMQRVLVVPYCHHHDDEEGDGDDGD